MDYPPDDIDDPSFCGIAEDLKETCRIHNVLPERRIAFEGTNTGRRFYVCSVSVSITWSLIGEFDIVDLG